MKNKHIHNIRKLTKHYNNLFLTHKNSHNTAQQSSRKTQEKRMSILIKDLEFKKKSTVLDFGCGTGHLYNVLSKNGFKGKYLGIDISDKIIEFSNKKFRNNKNVNFLNLDILNSKKFIGKYDYILVNGTFNNLAKNNWDFMKDCLKILFKKTKVMLAFNNLSYYVDYFDKGLYYVRPEEVFKFCKLNLSDAVSIRNDYQIKKGILPFEFIRNQIM